MTAAAEVATGEPLREPNLDPTKRYRGAEITRPPSNELAKPTRSWVRASVLPRDITLVELRGFEPLTFSFRGRHTQPLRFPRRTSDHARGPGRARAPLRLGRPALAPLRRPVRQRVLRAGRAEELAPRFLLRVSHCRTAPPFIWSAASGLGQTSSRSAVTSGFSRSHTGLSAKSCSTSTSPVELTSFSLDDLSSVRAGAPPNGTHPASELGGRCPRTTSRSADAEESSPGTSDRGLMPGSRSGFQCLRASPRIGGSAIAARAGRAGRR